MASAGGVFFLFSLPFGQKSRKSRKFSADARTAVGNNLQDLPDFAMPQASRRTGSPGHHGTPKASKMALTCIRVKTRWRFL